MKEKRWQAGGETDQRKNEERKKGDRKGPIATAKKEKEKEGERERERERARARALRVELREKEQTSKRKTMLRLAIHY
jgi:hypothetical protein